MSLNYKNSGVDVEAGDELVDWLAQGKKQAHPFQQNLISGIGGFASVFRANFPNFKSPCIVTSTDGVGTKVKLSSHFKRYETIGQDLVGMCVNDILCVGAQPLLFLDYYASGKLELAAAKKILAGIQAACAEAQCLLVGGETAEMPGVYSDGDFDLAGFVVGVVDEDKMLGAHRVQSGDALLGVASSGFHSNGYSLLRKVYADSLHDNLESLLLPTRLYTRFVLEMLKHAEINAIAHITGGGMDNLLRVIPETCGASLKRWSIPPAFIDVQKRSGMDEHLLLRTLNCGIGLILVVPMEAKEKVINSARNLGESLIDLGSVTHGPHEWVVGGGKS